MTWAVQGKEGMQTENGKNIIGGNLLKLQVFKYKQIQ